MSMGDLWIGIDGGGTGCRAAVAGPKGVIATATAGPANATSDFDGTVANLTDLLGSLYSQCPEARSAPGHAGIAGVLTPAEASRLVAKLPGTFVVTDDRPTTLTGALGAADGVVAAIGTGSFVGRCQAGKHHFLGGHGLVLGDDASAAWLGKALLRNVLGAAEEMQANSPFLTEVFKTFHSDSASISRFASTATPGDFAAYAPQVADAAEAGDPAADALMHQAATYLSKAAHLLDPTETLPFCLAGGGLSQRYLKYLPAGLQARIMPSQGPALDGALTLARQIR